MEKETIIKALECCTSPDRNCDCGYECPYGDLISCTQSLMAHALALIKELTEENEKLRKAKVVYETVDYCADDLAKALKENKRLTEENERINLEYKGFETATNQILKTLKSDFAKENERLKSEVSVKKKLLDKCVDLEDRVKADTLNDMQTRFAMHFGTYRPTDEVKVTEVFKLLKKISEEMLYEEEEEEDK